MIVEKTVEIDSFLHIFVFAALYIFISHCKWPIFFIVYNQFYILFLYGDNYQISLNSFSIYG